eukprot:424081-Pleurochrysis_carterae.AAC.1
MSTLNPLARPSGVSSGDDVQRSTNVHAECATLSAHARHRAAFVFLRSLTHGFVAAHSLNRLACFGNGC